MQDFNQKTTERTSLETVEQSAVAGRFEQLNMDSFRNSMGPLEKCLRDSGFDKRNGHDVVLVGGSMHHQFRLSLLQWNPGPARKYPSHIFSAACGKFHAVILQEASDHVPHISDQFMAFTDNTDLAILLNKDTFEPDPIVNSFKADSTSKGTWGMILLTVRGFLRRPSITGSPTVTFCSVHIHNVVAKKRDASTDRLQRLHGYMCEYNVDFIGGDFNMSAFSTVGDVFTDQEFSAPGNSLLWVLVHWRSRSANVPVFSSCQNDLTSGVSIHMVATNLTMRYLAWDPETNLLISQCSFIFVIPICPDPAASCEVTKHKQRRLERRHDKERMQRRRSSRKCT